MILNSIIDLELDLYQNCDPNLKSKFESLTTIWFGMANCLSLVYRAGMFSCCLRSNWNFYFTATLNFKNDLGTLHTYPDSTLNLNGKSVAMIIYHPIGQLLSGRSHLELWDLNWGPPSSQLYHEPSCLFFGF